MSSSLTLLKPDDWHLHLRDGDRLSRTVNDSAKQFARAIIMPNLQPPVTTIQQAEAYKARIMAALDTRLSFQPLMTLYLTNTSSPELIKAAAEHPDIVACKLYPAGATTHSAQGVTDLTAICPTLEAMQKYRLPLLLHGEVTDPEVDIFDREARFIETKLMVLQKQFPELRIVLEHITTKNAVDYILSANKHSAATITAHHLLYDRNIMLVGGIKPHYYCLPVLKRATHREALLQAATSGNPKFFLGTDSAPHSIHTKEAACGCAGIYSAYSALELYAQAFESMNALDKLEGFASGFGADFYGLPRNKTTVTLEKSTWQVPNSLSFGAEHIQPLAAGETLSWKLQNHE